MEGRTKKLVQAKGTLGDMPHHEVPSFPRGFLLSDRQVTYPPSFIEGPLLQNFYIHPWLDVEVAGDSEAFVIILGHCVPTAEAHEEFPASRLLGALRTGQESFFHVLGEYSGRHAIVFGNTRELNVVTDATGMRSVFYAAQGGVVSSHALLVERALGGPPTRDDLPFKFGYPGNRTPYSRTRLLTPNTYYAFHSNKVRRFWPHQTPIQRTVDEAAVEVLNAATVAMRNMAFRRKVKIALTAGVDSRTVLAVAINAGVAFETYTYGDGRDTARDRAFARDLSSKLGICHTLVPRPKHSRALDDALKTSTYAPHHAKYVGGLMDHFEETGAAAVTGNLLEIGRANYSLHRQAGAAAPTTAEAMAELHRRNMGSRMGPVLDEYGVDNFHSVARQAFQEFYDDTEYGTTLGVLDPFDQFYWEHWMGAWHGPAMVERDFYGIAFIPFNSRRVFETLLGVSRLQRDRSEVFYRMIQLVRPALLDLPVNPKKWPAS